MLVQDAVTHERRVKLAKVLLLSVFVVISGMIFVLPFISTKTHESLKIISSEPSESLSEPQTIIKPKFYGFDGSNRPYTIAAESGTQIDKNNVELQKVFSDIKLDQDKNYLTLTSDKANVTLDEKKLNLIGNIEIIVDSDYKVNTNTAVVNYGEKIVNGDAVNVIGSMGTIDAESFSIDESYKIITFKDRVHTTLNSK